ncbi:helix-turn-helix domain-containing protein [Marixanthomonas spongiae]|nr:AraC family transcriptional regulator [Marixanthomonas spongiae]
MFKTFEAHPRLQAFILFYFELNWQKKQPNETIKHLSLPTGCSFMGFQSSGNMQIKIDEYTYTTERFYVNAQTTLPYYMCYSGNHLKAVVACLKPTALYHLFKIDVSTLINTGANPVSLFKGRLGASFQARFKTNTTAENIRELDALFIAQLNEVTPRFNFVDTTIDIIVQSKGEIKLKELIQKLQVSKRYFQKKFKAMVGIPPSVYMKIIRYNFIFSSLKEEELHYTSTSAPFYFYDSAHYSNDFKKYMGICPSQFNPEHYPFLKLTAIEKAVWINAFQSLATT